MTESLILVDTNFLANRAFYSTGHLRHHDIPTGIIYGVLREIRSLQDRFDSEQFVFCFDGSRADCLRRKKYPFYKANRTEFTYMVERKRQREQLFIQLDQLYEDVLPSLGFVNIYQFPGYEADDLIAAVCHLYLDEMVIVSADSDLYQLLHKRIIMYDPRGKKTVTKRSFKTKFGILPKDWPMVKAIAGCHTDNIPGVFGVGEKYAVRYIRGEMEENSKLYKQIKKEWERVEVNLPLVTLPFDGCPIPVVRKQASISRDKWMEVFEQYGIDSVNV